MLDLLESGQAVEGCNMDSSDEEEEIEQVKQKNDPAAIVTCLEFEM